MTSAADASLIFYTNPMSRGQIVRWMLEEVGAPYDTRVLDYGSTMKDAAYLAINPMGKVPAITHNGHTVTECAAICAYLADAFRDAGLAPQGDEHAPYYRWLFFAAGPVEQAVITKSMGWDTGGPSKSTMLGFGDLERPLDVLDAHFATHDYVCGDRFTAADVYVGSQVLWGLDFGTITARPNLSRYAERLRARDAYQRGKAIDGALIAEAKGASAP